MSRAERQGGFTLVEVLVALVVSALLLAIIFDGSIGGRQREKLAADRGKAILLADTLLASAVADAYQQGERSGVSNGLNWAVTERLALVDPRGTMGLVALEAKVSNRTDHALFSAHLLRLKALTPP
jgi:prepilin-type N-terminal cleavage/methylation domain-containing protein